MFGLTTLGFIHTLISLVAVAAGIAALVMHGAIGLGTRSGKLYVLMTVLTCLTGFGIFQHGGFGPPHVLGIVTLVVLAVAALAGQRAAFGRLSRYIAALGYSLTLFFHWIPAINETGTRLPAGAPLFTGPEDPALQPWVGAGFLVFLIIAAVQVLRLRRAPAGHAAPAIARH